MINNIFTELEKITLIFNDSKGLFRSTEDLNLRFSNILENHNFFKDIGLKFKIKDSRYSKEDTVFYSSYYINEFEKVSFFIQTNFSNDNFTLQKINILSDNQKEKVIIDYTLSDEFYDIDIKAKHNSQTYNPLIQLRNYTKQIIPRENNLTLISKELQNIEISRQMSLANELYLDLLNLSKNNVKFETTHYAMLINFFFDNKSPKQEEIDLLKLSSDFDFSKYLKYKDFCLKITNREEKPTLKNSL